MRNHLLVVVCAAACCAGTARKSEPAAGSSAGQETGSLWDVSLAVQLPTAERPGWREFPPNGALTSGAEFALSIELLRPAHLLVAQRSGDQPVSVIYPASDGSATAGTPARITKLPGSGEWFKLDEKPGDDALFVLATTQPISPAQGLQLLQDRAPAACKNAREPPPIVQERDRGGIVREKLDKDGIAVLCFPFVHR